MGSATLPLVGTALSAYGQHEAGVQASQAAAFEQQQLDLQSKQILTAAAQAEAQRRRDLTSSLETIEAIRAGRGVGMASPGAAELNENVITSGERDTQNERLNFLLKSDNARMAAVMAGKKAKYSLLAGNLAAGATVASGLTKAMSSFGMPAGASAGY